MNIKGVIVVFLTIIMLMFPVFVNAQIWDGVTCNQPGQGPCDLCDMAHVAANVLDLLLQIVLYLGMAFVVVGALMMILGSTNQKYYDQGRDAIKWALIGVAVATTAWLVVGTIFATFANQQFSASWDEIDCDRFDFLTEPPGTSTHVPQQPGEGTGVGAPEPTDEPETPPVTSAQQLATNLLSLAGGAPSCGTSSGNMVGPGTNLREIRDGEALTVCSNGCTPSGGCAKNPSITFNMQILQALDELRRESGVNFVITSLTTGSHSPNSRHYQGNAVDISAVRGWTYSQVQSFFQNRGLTAFCEASGAGQVPCTNNVISHLHIQI